MSYQGLLAPHPRSHAAGTKDDDRTKGFLCHIPEVMLQASSLHVERHNDRTKSFARHIPEVMLQAALLHAPPVCSSLQQLDCRALSGALMLHALALQLYCPHHKLLLHHTLHLQSQMTQVTGLLWIVAVVYGALMLHALALQLYCPHHKLLLHQTLHLHSQTTQVTGLLCVVAVVSGALQLHCLHHKLLLHHTLHLHSHTTSYSFALCHGCSVLS